MSIKYNILKIRCALINKLGQRGAEMVEYAIVLACIAIVACAYYHINAWFNPNPNIGVGTTTKSALDYLFGKITRIISKTN